MKNKLPISTKDNKSDKKSLHEIYMNVGEKNSHANQQSVSENTMTTEWKTRISPRAYGRI